MQRQGQRRSAVPVPGCICWNQDTGLKSLGKEVLINQNFLSGAGMHHHFSCVKRGENDRRRVGADMINSQERINQSYRKLGAQGNSGLADRILRCRV